MADVTGKATEYEHLHIEHALASRKSIVVQATENCVEPSCGKLISSARQIETGGTDTCILCKEKLERSNAR